MSGTVRTAALIAFVLLASQALVSCTLKDETIASPFMYGIVPETEDANNPPPKAGRYWGFARMDDMRSKLSVIVDLVAIGFDRYEVRYRTIAKFFVGGFNSHEYTSAYYPGTYFDRATKKLVLGETKQDLAITDVELNSNGLTARIQSLTGKIDGELVLHRRFPVPEPETPLADIFPEVPVTRPLTGHYTGKCNDEDINVQLEATKWRGNQLADGATLGGYQITGRWGTINEVMCGKDRLCTKHVYTSAIYNVFDGRLDLQTRDERTACQANGSSLVCGDCALSKLESHDNPILTVDGKDPRSKRRIHLQFMRPTLRNTTKKASTVEEFDGQYYGYLHHEGLDKYQLFALKVKGQAPGNPNASADLSAVATLYFGYGESNEFIAHKFATGSYPNPFGNYIFDGDGEGFLVIESWYHDSIVATWYSKVFGRVGTLELQKNIVPSLSRRTKLFDALSGSYQGGDWHYELLLAAGISENQWDFSPLRIYGWTREQAKQTRRQTIETGVFDFYSGALSFRLDDGRIVSGRVTGEGMELYWPSTPRYGLYMGEHHSAPYKKVSSKTSQARLFPLWNPSDLIK